MLAPSIVQLRNGILARDGAYTCVVRAAISKSFEFSKHAWSLGKREEPFFLGATLRGVCEDLIALAFLSKLSTFDRNEAVQSLVGMNAEEGASAQSAFFSIVRPWQPVLTVSPERFSATEQRLRALASKLGWQGRRPWPSVRSMATSVELKPLYDYMYAVSSKWVHFSPQMLMRTGWSKDAGPVSDATEWTFTVAHFRRYYTDFVQVYSTYLLLLELQRLAPTIPEFVPPNTEKLSEKLHSILRWPEATTYEEMNIKPPHPLRLLLGMLAHGADPTEKRKTRLSAKSSN